MATTTRKNLTVKFAQSAMAKAKKFSPKIKLEWEIACNTNKDRGWNPTQSELMELYSRSPRGAKRGATKTCHIKSHLGDEFEFIVIKRHQINGYLPEKRNAKSTGNQLVDEINCWEEFAERPESDLLCPIFRHFTSKSDQVDAKSETMQNNVIIIAQKAVYIADASGACREAERLNRENGYHGESKRTRYAKLEAFSESQNWRDAMYNPGNSGVIFDYYQNCYKAVFIDYAL